jgi:hypothetical protein
MKAQITLTFHKRGGLLTKEPDAKERENNMDQITRKICELLDKIVKTSDIDDGPITITIEAGK